MEHGVSKHTNDNENSVSTDDFKFLEPDPNLLAGCRYRFRRSHFYCEVCLKGFSEENDLHYHRLDHVIDKPLFICDDLADEPMSENKTLSEDSKVCQSSDTVPEGQTSDIVPEDNKVCQTSNKVFICAECQKRFTTVSCLRIHQKFFHSESISSPSCDDCGSHFKWKHHLAVHKYADSNEKNSLCNTCSITTSEEARALDKCDDKIDAKNSLVSDTSRTHQKPKKRTSKKNVCHICRREFSFKGNLNRHMVLVHVRKKILASKLIGKKYSKKTKVNSEKIAKKKSFTCNVCEKAFTHEGYLVRHLRLHSEKRFFCRVCHNAFLDDTALQQHLSIHFDGKAIVCHYCFKSFEYQQELDCHLQIHSYKKPYPCDFCDKRFIRKGYLTTHIMRFHSTKRPA